MQNLRFFFFFCFVLTLNSVKLTSFFHKISNIESDKEQNQNDIYIITCVDLRYYDLKTDPSLIFHPDPYFESSYLVV